MLEKTQESFKLILGTNDKNITKEDLIRKAIELEQKANDLLGVKVHILRDE